MLMMGNFVRNVLSLGSYIMTSVNDVPSFPGPVSCIIFIISEAQVIFVSLPSLTLLPASDESIFISGVIIFYFFFLNTVKLALLSLFYMGHNPTRL